MKSDLEYVTELLLGYFANEEAAYRWLNTPNPSMGGSTPKALIEAGKGQKVVVFVERMLGGY